MDQPENKVLNTEIKYLNNPYNFDYIDITNIIINNTNYYV